MPRGLLYLLIYSNLVKLSTCCGLGGLFFQDAVKRTYGAAFFWHPKPSLKKLVTLAGRRIQMPLFLKTHPAVLQAAMPGHAWRTRDFPPLLSSPACRVLLVIKLCCLNQEVALKLSLRATLPLYAAPDATDCLRA